MIKTILLCLALSMLLGTAAMAEPENDFSQGIEAAVAAYMEENGIPESRVGIGWYDIVSGESWFLNGDVFMNAGSMYKLPLNMLYTDLLSEGSISPEDIVGGSYTVETAMMASMVYSDNDAAQALKAALNTDNRTYRAMLAQYSQLDPESLPDEFYTQNHVSSRFMINTLRALYDDSEHYSAVIDYMKQGHPTQYFRKYETEFEIAHKYGYFEGVLSDCGIIFTERPFLLVVMTDNLWMGEELMAHLVSLFAEYSEYLVAEDEQLAPEETDAPEESEPTPTAAPPEETKAPAETVQPEETAAPEMQPEETAQPAEAPATTAPAVQEKDPESAKAEAFGTGALIAAAVLLLLALAAHFRRGRKR